MTAFLLALVLHVSSNHDYAVPSSQVVCGAGTQAVVDAYSDVIECDAVGYGGYGSSSLISVGYPLNLGGFGNFGEFGRFGRFGNLGGFGGLFHQHHHSCTPVAPATTCVS